MARQLIHALVPPLASARHVLWHYESHGSTRPISTVGEWVGRSHHARALAMAGMARACALESAFLSPYGSARPMMPLCVNVLVCATQRWSRASSLVHHERGHDGDATAHPVGK